MKKLFACVLLLLPVILNAQGNDFFLKPERGFTSWLPAHNWEHALLSGNGTIGAMVMGHPHNETIILSHAALYMPLKRSGKLINQAAKLEDIRQLMLEGKYQEAAKIPVQLRNEEGYFDQRDPFIPAFDIKISHQASNIKRYQRSVNFETGEAIVDWEDGNGIFQRRTFVSRTDSVIVVSVKGNSGFDCNIYFNNRPVEWNQQDFFNKHMQSMQAGVENNWLSFDAEFKIKNEISIHRYKGLGKVIIKKGVVNTKGNMLEISDAEEILLLVRIYPISGDRFDKVTAMKKIDELPTQYSTLLSSHSLVHGELFNKVRLSLFSDSTNRELDSEVILLRSKTKVSPALIEKTFDAGRYNIISATGFHPPNLQGLWSGTWAAPWAGSMTNDGNLPVAISFLMPGNTMQLMDAYFSYHENLMNDYRQTAKALYGCEGIHIPAQQTTTGIDTDFNETWCLTFWTGGAGWAASYFWDYFQYSLDESFLEKRAYPFMKEAARFYECFLQKEKNGQIIFNPSYSPENTPANSNSQATINATMDVMIAKQLLSNCIKAADILSVDKEKVQTWQSLINAFPSYKIAEDGTLCEWLWKDFSENHRHRHVSHLYALFNEVEPVFKNNQELRQAALKLVDEKMKFRVSEGGGEMSFGLVQLALAAAHLGEGEKCWQMVELLASRYWSSGMASFHNVGHLFNMDISGGLPYLVSQMLVYSEIGFINLLPALPIEWKQGSIEGLLLKGNMELKELSWNNMGGTLILHSEINQKLRIIFPEIVTIRNNKNSGKIKEMEIELNAGVDTKIHFEKINNK